MNSSNNVIICCTIEKLENADRRLSEQCIRKNVSFQFRQCGTHFLKDGKEYTLQVKDLCRQARLAGIDYERICQINQGFEDLVSSSPIVMERNPV